MGVGKRTCRSTRSLAGLTLTFVVCRRFGMTARDSGGIRGAVRHAGIRSEALVSEEGVPFCVFPVIFDFC